MNFSMTMVMRQSQVRYIAATAFNLTSDMMETPLHIIRNLLLADRTITALIQPQAQKSFIPFQIVSHF